MISLFTRLRRGMLPPEPTPVETDKKLGYWVRFSKVQWSQQFYFDGRWHHKTGPDHGVHVGKRNTVVDFLPDTPVFIEKL